MLNNVFKQECLIISPHNISSIESTQNFQNKFYFRPKQPVIICLIYPKYNSY